MQFEDSRSKHGREAYTKEQKLKRQIRQDKYQYERYKARLGDDAPKSFHAFRRMKNTGGENWGNLQYKYKLYSRGRKNGVLPNSHVASTPESKLKGYLLSSTHPVGKHKAKVINSVLGYNEKNWNKFSDNLYQEIQKSPLNEVKAFTYIKDGVKMDAVKYTVPIVMSGIKGRTLRMNTVWQIEKGANIPRFITATFPKKKGGA